MMQHLSARMAQYSGGGASLPGGLHFKQGFYADDVFLVAESIEELQQMLAICETWAASVGLQFNVPKSKVMVLAGPPNPQLPAVPLAQQVLEWTEEFPYLGFPIYAYNETKDQLPVDLRLLNPVLQPLASTLLPQATMELPLANRVDVLMTMTESKVLHNSPQADVSYTNMDKKVNKWLGKVAGLPINVTSATFLRCELGVLPSQLVGERNALYYLWHLRNRTWFKRYLPHLQDLPPLARLTELLLDNNITLEEFHQIRDVGTWHDTVREAILTRAQSWYNTSPHTERLPNFGIIYRGRDYLRKDKLCDLAEVALQARADRLSGVNNAWEYHACPFCHQGSGLNGGHLLQCDSLPSPLAERRDQLRGDLSTRAYTARVLTCATNSFSNPEDLRRGLCFADKVFKAARKTCQVPPVSSQLSEAAGAELEVSQ